MDIQTQFINESCTYLALNLPRVKKCIELLTEDEIWHNPGTHTNSIANLILHLKGNITQYILSGLGGIRDTREREKEFTTKSGHTGDELYQMLETTVLEANKVLENLPVEMLTANYTVQGFTITGIGIIVHVTEHFSYHTGQIAFLTKYLKDEDLGFYSGLDLNQRNR